VPLAIPTQNEIETAIRELFHRAHTDVSERLLTALLPMNRTAVAGRALTPDILDRELDELCVFANGFENVLCAASERAEDGVPAGTPGLHTRLQSLVYCHVMEADYPYVVVLNLLRILAGRDCCMVFYQRDAADEIQHRTDGIQRVCEHPIEKIEELRREDATVESGIGDMLKRLWSSDLRNAFSHSQYYIQNDGALLATRRFAGVTGETVTTGTQRNEFFTKEQIKTFHDGALSYLRTFIDCHKQSIQPFKDGGFHSVETSGGQIRWDEETVRWTWQEPD